MKSRIINLIIVTILGVVFVGCHDNNVYANQEQDFEVLSKEYIGAIENDQLIIVQHKETGKRFIIYKGYYKGGITPLD